MPIMASTLSRDMMIFFRYQFSSIVLLALLTTLISVVIGYLLSPGSEELMTLSDGIYMGNLADMNLQELIRQMSIEQRRVLLQASAAGTLASLVGNVLLAGGLLTMIRLVSNRQSVSVLRAISLSTPLLPRLLLLIFLSTSLIQLGMLLIIVPGILLAIAFSLAPVIIAASDNLGVIKSMRISASLAIANLRLLAPAVLFWLLAKAAVLMLATQFTLGSSLITTVLLNGLSNLISALLLIYLYRLYMLVQ